jgi:hypothetical protein
MNEQLPENTTQLQGKGRWKKGQSGNPLGKPKGARCKSVLLREAIDLIASKADALDFMSALTERIKGGDVAAMRLFADVFGLLAAKHLEVRAEISELYATEEELRIIFGDAFDSIRTR